MKQKLKLMAIVALSLYVIGVHAQSQTYQKISGVVKDKTGTLPGVTVVVKGTTNGTITDNNGGYSLTNIPNHSVLTFSFMGMKSQDISVDGKTTINVVLQNESIGLDEVVAIGYGVSKKSDLTGALSSVDSKKFADQNVTRVDQVLQGRASGVQVTSAVGAPGGETRIRIRGANSVLGDNSPLFVVDGFVGVNIDMVNPNDIKSVEVLKDAASTAVYGSRGANGVVLITTKSGSKDGKLSIDYEGSYSLSNVVKKYDELSAADFAQTVNDRNAEIGLSPAFSQTDIDGYKTNGGFDYQDAIFRQAVSTEHQLSLSGGTEKTQYRISLGYLNQEGIIQNSNFDRFNLRSNIATKINDKLSFRMNISGSSMTGLNTQNRNGSGSPITGALSWAPTTDPHDGQGGYTMSDPVGSIKTNPLALLYDTENKVETSFANVAGGAKYEIISGLALDFQAGVDLSYVTTKDFAGNYATNNSPYASITDEKSANIQTTTQLSYVKKFNKIHSINAVAVIETQKYTSNFTNASSTNLKFPEMKYNNLAQAETYNVGSGFSQWTLLSYLARINYSLKDKYLATVSVRTDGSSKFAKGNKYSTFPSVALAWNAASEPFISDLNIFSKLKFRGSWGKSGSQAISPYATLSTYNTGVYYAFSEAGKTSGIQLSNPANHNLRWETTDQIDLGFETGFFQGRLNFDFDYFWKDTHDLLLNKTVPDYLGGGNIISNVGTIGNKGWELSVNGKIIENKKIRWDADFNISQVKNIVKSLGDETRIFSHPDMSGLNGQPEFVYQVGAPLGSFWGLKYLGPWKPSEAAEAAKYGMVPGDARYQDVDGNHSYDGGDYQIIGCGMPKVTLGFNNTVNVNNFELNVFFQGVFGLDKQNYTRAIHLMGARDARQATLSEIKDRYIPGVNENAYLPAFSNTSQFEPQSTICLEDGSYVRLKNLSLGYNFKLKRINKLKLYMSATNLLTFTKYTGIDPESSSTGGGGSDINQSLDYGAYPNARTYTLGINLTF